MNQTFDTTERPTETIDRDESSRLISSAKVDGTPVYATDGERIGHIDHLMIGKYDGKVAFSVMSFGGFLGLGHDHYPVPWARLDYNPKLQGYEVNITDAELKAAPHFDPGKEYSWDTLQGQKIYGHYGVPTYWA